MYNGIQDCLGINIPVTMIIITIIIIMNIVPFLMILITTVINNVRFNPQNY